MGQIRLRIEDLVLDSDNPRITHSESQRETLQKVVRDQGGKLLKLAESISKYGLSPIERFMVMEVSAKPRRYVALEGNRRVAALKLLSNPAAMTDITISSGFQGRMERLAETFKRATIEPIDCFQVASREEGKYWIELRHNGEDEGRGIVGWKPIVAARFRERGPAIEAFDMVMEHGGLSEKEAEAIKSGFALSTLKRLMDSPDVQALVGLTVEGGRLYSDIPAAELIKPLRRMIRDIAEKKVDSRAFNKKSQMVDYVQGFAKADRADLAKRVGKRPIDGIETSEFAQPPKPSKAATSSAPAKAASGPADRKQVIPKNCKVSVTDNRIDEIYRELRALKLSEAPNAIAVLLRVFLELSVDHFLENNGGKLSVPKPGGGERFKTLDKKLAEVVDMVVSVGVPRSHFAQIIRAISVDTSPMNIDLLHSYVHSRFATPLPAELKAAWDHAQPLFEKIWP